MKLQTLIEELIKIRDGEEANKDLEVRLHTDHGQCSMAATWVGIGAIDSDEYMADSIHPDDLEYYPDAIPMVEIQGF